MRGEVTQNAKRIVVKVGTSLLSGGSPGLDLDYVRALADALAAVRGRGKDVALVTSGAIGAGLEPLGLDRRPRSLRHLQAAAAVGQGRLTHAYAEALRPHGLIVGQVLLTRDGIEHRERYLNARDTLLTLMEEGAVPVVNENDTVSVDEIRFGDNDTLAALVTKLVGADLLIVLTDVEGLCTADPRRADAQLIDEVEDITPEILALAKGAGDGLGSGGMTTKIEAARMATAAGAGMVLAEGKDPAVVGRILEGEKTGTFFCPKAAPMEARKFWIAFATPCSGRLEVNEGARSAIVEGGKSLLPVGVVGLSGAFRRGDTVSVVARGGAEFARGITYYDSSEVGKMLGHRTPELPGLLGAAYSEDEVVHRDNLVLL
jgi:glutamate 5-kinase